MDNRRNPLSTRDAARLLGVTSQTVRNWIAEGKLPACVVPGETRPCIRIDQRDVDQFWQRYSSQASTENQSSKPIN